MEINFTFPLFLSSEQHTKLEVVYGTETKELSTRSTYEICHIKNWTAEGCKLATVEEFKDSAPQGISHSTKQKCICWYNDIIVG